MDALICHNYQLVILAARMVVGADGKPPLNCSMERTSAAHQRNRQGG
jgi:hypothetical protein